MHDVRFPMLSGLTCGGESMGRAARKGEISMSSEAIGLLKAGRNALHWSQDDLAGNAGVSSATVKRIESRVMKTRKDALEALGFEDSRAPIRRKSIELMLAALERSGVSVWSNGCEVGISVRSCAEDPEFFDVAKGIKEK